MSDTPLWLQITIPVFTVGGGFAAGRLAVVIDRRRKARERAAERKPAFEVTFVHGTRYRLKNTGDKAATGIRIETPGYQRDRLEKVPEEPFSLAAGQHIDFGIPTGAGTYIGGIVAMPSALVVSCAELPEAVHTEIP